MRNIIVIFIVLFFASCTKQMDKKVFEVELIETSQFDCRISVIQFVDTTGMKAACGFSSVTAMTREIPAASVVKGKRFYISIKAAPDAVLCTTLGPAPPPLLVITDLVEKK
jgi:hypothetical protein